MAVSVDSYLSSSIALQSKTLDLSRKELIVFPPTYHQLKSVECLYLEGNNISELPEDLFHYCTNLKYLDLRNNSLTELPSSIKHLKGLRTLLLSGNNIQSLPLELGLLRHLNGLNLTDNPLEFPPPEVLKEGTRATLAFLRSLLNECDTPSNDVTGEIEKTRASLQPIGKIHMKQKGTKSGDDHKRVQLVPQYSPSLPGLPSPGYQALKVHQQNTDTVTKRRLTYASTGVTSSKSPSGRIQVINPKKGVDRAQNQKGGAKGSILNKKEIIPKHHHKDTNPHSKADIDFVIEKQKSKECLSNWRQQTEGMKVQLQVGAAKGKKVQYTRAAEMAPFGTDFNIGSTQPSINSQPHNTALSITYNSTEGYGNEDRFNERENPLPIHKSHKDASYLDHINDVHEVEDIEVNQNRRSQREYRLTAFNPSLSPRHKHL